MTTYIFVASQTGCSTALSPVNHPTSLVQHVLSCAPGLRCISFFDSTQTISEKNTDLHICLISSCRTHELGPWVVFPDVSGFEEFINEPLQHTDILPLCGAARLVREEFLKLKFHTVSFSHCKQHGHLFTNLTLRELCFFLLKCFKRQINLLCNSNDTEI